MKGILTLAKKGALPFLSLAASIGTVIITVKCGVVLTNGEQFVFAVVMVTALWVLELLIRELRWEVQHSETVRLWELRNDGDGPLTNIRAHFDQLLKSKYSERDLFIEHFIERFKDLQSVIRDAAEKHELFVRSHHFASVSSVLSAFSGEDDPVHRYVWIVEPGERLFAAHDVAGPKYFTLIDEMARGKKLQSVRALLVARSLGDLQDPRIGKLLDFYKTNRRFECKVITLADYENLQKDSNIVTEHIDFGIYGTRLMFLTKTYEPDTTGVFVKDPQRVSRYIKFFDHIWSSSGCKKNPSAAKTVLRCDDLVEFDRSHQG